MGKPSSFVSNFSVCGFTDFLGALTTFQKPKMAMPYTSLTHLLLGQEISIQVRKLHSREPTVLRNYQERLKGPWPRVKFFHHVYGVSLMWILTFFIILYKDILG